MVVPISTGTTASCPKAKVNGVSPVAILWVVLYVHNTPDSSLTHAPFFAPSLIFKSLFIVLLAASTCPLD